VSETTSIMEIFNHREKLMREAEVKGQTKLLDFGIFVMFDFDGGECEARWMACGVPKGVVPNQYVEHCERGGKNLHIYHLGSYNQCGGCEKRVHCRNFAACCGEQASE
jgi:hypothetical protein